MKQRFLHMVGVAGILLLAGCSGEKRLSTSSQDALRAYKEGVKQWERFYYPEAMKSFQQALGADSNFAMAWCRIAMINAATRNLNGAKAAMQRALSAAPRVTERERLFITMWQRRLEFDNVGAASVADSLLKLYPDEKEAYLFRGNLYEEVEKDYDGALRAYQKAVEADSNYAQAVMSLGYAYSTLGDQQKAVELMQRYIRLAPDAADPRASYADVLVRAGMYDEALEQYKKSLELKPDYWYAVREIGTVYAILGRLTEAEGQFHKSLALLPMGQQLESPVLVADGSLNMKRGQYEKAAEQFAEALRLDSLDGSAAYGLARALGKLKKFAQAQEVVDGIKAELARRHLTSSTAMASYHLTRAALLSEEGRLEEGLVATDSAMEYTLPLTRASVYRQRAEIHLLQGALEDALDDCDQALEVNPNNPSVLLTLTKIYHRKGDTRMAVEIGSRLLAFWNGADTDFSDRNELLRLLGKNFPS